MMATGKEFEVIETGVFTPQATHRDELKVGDVGYLICIHQKCWRYTSRGHDYGC